jgi:hypothetical protein
VNVTPVGNVPVSVNAGVGEPVAVTMKLPVVPAVNVVALADVIVGACPADVDDTIACPTSSVV